MNHIISSGNDNADGRTDSDVEMSIIVIDMARALFFHIDRRTNGIRESRFTFTNFNISSITAATATIRTKHPAITSRTVSGSPKMNSLFAPNVIKTRIKNIMFIDAALTSEFITVLLNGMETMNGIAMNKATYFRTSYGLTASPMKTFVITGVAINAIRYIAEAVIIASFVFPFSINVPDVTETAHGTAAIITHPIHNSCE